MCSSTNQSSKIQGKASEQTVGPISWVYCAAHTDTHRHIQRQRQTDRRTKSDKKTDTQKNMQTNTDRQTHQVRQIDIDIEVDIDIHIHIHNRETKIHTHSIKSKTPEDSCYKDVTLVAQPQLLNENSKMSKRSLANSVGLISTSSKLCQAHMRGTKYKAFSAHNRTHSSREAGTVYMLKSTFQVRIDWLQKNTFGNILDMYPDYTDKSNR